ncbi:hypothetical protein ACF061_20825 [Streptomyces sp. NPDC015220]|uniref:hypothetical protein n=1 Tax=Streptomyces sp. NPDC015220 TaxID=3364947 RepID=UPI0036F7D4F1
MTTSKPDDRSGLARRYSEQIARDLEHNLREQARVRGQQAPDGAELADLRAGHRFLMSLRRTLDSFLASPPRRAEVSARR